MYGRGLGAVRIGGGGTAPGPVSVPSGGSTPTTRQGASDYHNSIVWTLAILVVAYVIWALIETHEKVRSSLEPKNIYFNLRSIVLVTVTVILGINILRILFAKLAALNVPGAAQLLAVVANA